ncbi:MAG: PqqD family protein [Euryarchaeota archaeon]|jgi:hypothetical protein|nr:PqqD family protein [Euryarchaeota archaeon]
MTSKGLPTVDEFLLYRPKRLEFKWSTNTEGLVTLTVPKFTGKVGKSFCSVLKRENTFEAHLDRLGSSIWNQCDGATLVKDILVVVIKQFPDEKNIDQRLFLFLQQLRALNYITY